MPKHNLKVRGLSEKNSECVHIREKNIEESRINW